MKFEYTTSTFGYYFLTKKKRNNYFKNNVMKFSVSDNKNYENKIFFTYCGDKNFGPGFHKNWDLFVLFIDKNNISEKDKKHISTLFKNKIPLYPIFAKNYILISKIISKQIYQLAKTCTIRDIGDIYLYEFGAVLTDKYAYNKINFPRHFGGTEIPLVYEIVKSDVVHINKKMHGWFSKNTELLLKYCLKKFEYKKIVELGSWFGRSTSFIVDNMKKGSMLYCFDKFQNVANTGYQYDKESPMDNFYFTTPRYETFCKNVSEHLSDDKKVYTIKYDVNQFIKILSVNFILPDIIFIDAIKKKESLVHVLSEIFRSYPHATVIGDDYVFDSVKNAIYQYTYNNKKINLYETSNAYLLTNKTISKSDIDDFIKKNYFPPKHSNQYVYDKIQYYLALEQPDEVIKLLQNNKVDVNKKLENDNTIYTSIVYSIYQSKKTNLIPVQKYVEENYKVKKVDNVLGLDYKDYMEHNDLMI